MKIDKIINNNTIKKLAYFSILASSMGASVISIDFGAFQLSLFRLIIMLMAASAILKMIINKERFTIAKSQNSYSIKFMLIWLVYAFISIFWVKDHGGWVKAVYFLGLGTLCTLVYNKVFQTSEDILKSLGVMSIMIIFHNLIGWYEIITGHYIFFPDGIYSPVYGLKFIQPLSIFSNTNDFATFLFVSIWILVICAANSKTKLSRAIYIAAAVSSVLLLAATISRANMLGIILSLLVFIYLSMEKKRKLINIVYAALALLLLIIVMPKALNYFAQLINYSIGSGNSLEMDSDFVRLNLIRNGIQFLISTFGFGTGAGNVEYWMANYSNYPTNGIINMHSWWIEILVGYGVIIFVLYNIFYILLMRDLFKRCKNYKSKVDRFISLGFLCIMIGFIISSISSSSNMNKEWLWVFWAIVTSYQGIKYEQN